MQHIILLGDSLTQQGYLSGWVSSLSDRYVRRADVINRGLSGYNTRWVLDVLKDEKRRQHLLPPHTGRPLFVTLMLGSNDCARREQHVPLKEYKENLKEIIAIVRKQTNPVGGIFLLTPPPNDEAWLVKMHEYDITYTESDRPFAIMREYRNAALEVGAEGNREHGDVFHVDLFRAFLGEDADTMPYTKGSWCDNFSDGLHFNENGANILFDVFWSVVERSPKASEILPDNIPFVLPPFEALIGGSK